MRNLIIFIIMLSPIRHNATVKDWSDFVEINHYYQYNHTEKAYEKQFVQVIWWEFRGGLFINRKGEHLNYPMSDFVVKDFRVIWSKTSDPQRVNTIVPRRHRKKWICVFYDKQDGILREVTSKWTRISNTTYDPEMENRKVISPQHRSHLSKIP